MRVSKLANCIERSSDEFISNRCPRNDVKRLDVIERTDDGDVKFTGSVAGQKAYDDGEEWRNKT